MKGVIFWNCRGLGSPLSVSELLSLVRRYSPEILFLSETKSNKSEIRRIHDKLGFDNNMCVEAKGRAGGLDLF